MRKKLLVVLMTLILTVTAAAGMSITVNAAEGSGSSTYYYNLSKETSNTFSVGDVIFLTEVNTGVEDPDYLSYSWPSVLSAKVQVTSGMSAGNHYCNTALSGYASHYTVTVLQRSDNFDSCTQGCIYQGSGNQWYYSCNYGGVKNLTVYLYKCQTGSFTAGDVTFTWNPDGSISGAKIFEGTANEVTVPSYMIDIDDNTVDPSIGDYTRIAILGGVTAKAVDGSLAYEPYIQDLEGLSPAEKEVIKNELDLATSDAAVKQIISDAQTKSQNHLIAKENAKNDINAAVSSAKLQIDAMSNLSNEEKELKKQEIDNQAAITKTAIDTAYSDTLEEVLNNGLNAIDLVCDKAQAIDDINKSAADTKAYIDSLENLSNDEKTAMKDKVDSDAAASKSAITSATDTLGVEKATSDGLTAIQLDSAKAKAIDDINKSAADTKAYIDSLENLSDDEKIAMKDKVDSDAAASKSAINSATDTLGVEKATFDGLAAIQLDSAKAKVIDDINKSAADTKAYIGSLENLSDDEKIAMKDKVDSDAAASKSAITSATDTLGVEKATSDGLAAIQLDSVKAKAIDDINKSAADTKAYIDSLENLSNDEKIAMKDKVDSDAAASKSAINSATDTLGVEKATSDGLAAIQLDSAKAKATDDINKSAADTKAYIDSLENLSDDEKIAMKDKVDTNLTATLQKINDATVSDTLTPIVTDCITYNGIRAAESEAHDIVEGLTSLTDKEKENYFDIIEETVAAAFESIDATDTLANDYANILQGIEDTVISTLNDCTDDAIAEDFVKSYVADENGILYPTATRENIDQILSGKNDWDNLTETQRNKVNLLISNANKNIPGAPQSYEEYVLAGEEFATKSAEDFIKEYLTGADNNIYKYVTDLNYKQILSGKAVWDSLSNTEKETINKILAANGNDADNDTYPEMLAFTETIDKNVNEFIAKYLADENGNIHKYTTKENYLQILSGKADWDKLSETEQLAINALLAANGNDADNDTYPKMLAIAEAVEENANNFIAKYLTGDDGNIYKDATNENYLQILSGKAEWDKLSQLEKDAINEKLLANGGKTYEEMLKLAEELKELNSPQTSDAFSLQLWMLLVMLSGAILVLTRSRNKRFN